MFNCCWMIIIRQNPMKLKVNLRKDVEEIQLMLIVLAKTARGCYAVRLTTTEISHTDESCKEDTRVCRYNQDKVEKKTWRKSN